MSNAPAGGLGVVRRLYDAFEANDGAAMQACYAEDATFRDEVFDLHGADEIGAMWMMLTEGGGDLAIEVSGIEEDATTGRAHWVARYTFTATGRPVVNVIDATFELEDGLIIHHVDVFDFWIWSRQALGPLGAVLGWSPIVRGKVRKMARRRLDAHMARD